MRIFVILGKSASGKDTIFQRVLAECNLNPIVYYTTRPRRTGETHGKDYYFVTDKNGKFYFHKTSSEQDKTINSLQKQGLWIYEYFD
jgi:guanylate kinase